MKRKKKKREEKKGRDKTLISIPRAKETQIKLDNLECNGKKEKKGARECKQVKKKA